MIEIILILSISGLFSSVIAGTYLFKILPMSLSLAQYALFVHGLQKAPSPLSILSAFFSIVLLLLLCLLKMSRA